jgi:hypothetical protein
MGSAPILITEVSLAVNTVLLVLELCIAVATVYGHLVA